MEIIEEFSFPATAESCRFSIDSPPLWRVSTSTPSSPESSRRAEAEASTKIKTDQGSLNEEKMDMLWEDFNEELLFMGKQNPNCEFDSGDCSKEMVQFGCVKAFAISKGNKSGVVALLKVLRKMFLIHSKQLKLKKQHRPAAW